MLRLRYSYELTYKSLDDEPQVGGVWVEEQGRRCVARYLPKYAALGRQAHAAIRMAVEYNGEGHLPKEFLERQRETRNPYFGRMTQPQETDRFSRPEEAAKVLLREVGR